MSTSTRAESAEQPPVNERLKTQYSEVEVFCPQCRAQWSPPVANLVNVGTDPQAREGILRGTMHRPYCPRCKRILAVEHVFSYYDPDQQLLVQVRPAWEFKAGGGEDIYWKRLEEFVLEHAEDDVVVDIVFGFDELIEKHLGGQAAVAAAQERAKREKADGQQPGAYVGEATQPAGERDTNA